MVDGRRWWMAEGGGWLRVMGWLIVVGLGEGGEAGGLCVLCGRLSQCWGSAGYQ